ncbi:hypothetical protein FB451DRAFT_1370284 [Mycena latifolia]|nr:hypothetical protein FB451DRAFT_1370284 [Mycena latifolia]
MRFREVGSIPVLCRAEYDTPGPLYAATYLSCSIFVLAVAGMIIRFAGIMQLFVALYSAATVTTLFILLRLGRRRGSQLTLARTTSQIYVMSGLGLTWIGEQLYGAGISLALLIYQGWFTCLLAFPYSFRRESSAACVTFVAVDILVGSLALALFWAAYAVYRRAVALHGATMVPIPGPQPLVPAWRLAHVSDTVSLSVETKN